jgi:S-adenosylmethionine:tRNA ribosyltransferase-isomerase
MKKDPIRQLEIAHYTYDLASGKIAQYPLARRSESKLLVYDGQEITTARFDELPRLLPADSLLVFNNTRVIHARLLFRRATGALIEIFCLSPHSPADYAANFQRRRQCTWHCMTGNARRWKGEPLQMKIAVGSGVEVTLQAERKDEDVILFSWNDAATTFSELLEAAGKPPLPLYLKRDADAADEESYQTVYSREEGSVAAPTAGLHFTEEVLAQLRGRGIDSAEVTLHVGAGTFRPVKSATIGGHEMHTEFISVSVGAVERLLRHRGRVVVVGTTSMRTLESLYYIGRKLGENPNLSPSELSVTQWEAYDEAAEIAPKQALRNILLHLEATGRDRLVSSTQKLIAPGYTFHFPDAIITNFHQPQSTLLLLISAFVGDDWRSIYDYALDNDYRFLSYGDSSLLYKNTI